MTCWSFFSPGHVFCLVLQLEKSFSKQIPVQSQHRTRALGNAGTPGADWYGDWVQRLACCTLPLTRLVYVTPNALTGQEQAALQISAWRVSVSASAESSGRKSHWMVLATWLTARLSEGSDSGKSEPPANLFLNHPEGNKSPVQAWASCPSHLHLLLAWWYF